MAQAPEAAATAGDTRTAPSRERLSLSTMIIFGAPSFVAAAMAVPILVFMPQFYTDVVLVPAGFVALAIAVARCFDAITDPVMGYFTDRTRSRWGRRKPWIAIGAPFLALCFYLLFDPPGGMHGLDAGIWFALFFSTYFLFTTIVYIPHQALGAELSLDTRERGGLFGINAAFIALGTIIASILPTVLAAHGVSDARARFHLMAEMYAVGVVALYGLFLWKVRERPEFRDRGHNPLVPGVRRAMRNRPFRVMFLAAICYAIPHAIPATLMPYYTLYVIHPPHPMRWLGMFLLAYLGSGFLFLPLWVWLSRRIGKLWVWIICSFIGVTGGVALFFNGPGDQLRVLLLELYVGAQFGAFFFLGGAMHADVIDYDEFRTGQRREAQFLSFWTLIPKFATIPGAAIPVAILAWAGYVPNQAQTPEVILTIRSLFALLPGVFNLLGLVVMLWYPLSEARHRAIRAGIARHEQGLSARDPITGRDTPPPAEREVSAETAWFLDNFSRRELARLARNPEAGLLAPVWRAVGLSALALVACVVAATVSFDSLAHRPGPLMVAAVVAAGFALTAMLFQLLRVRPAMRLAASPPSREEIERHLDAVRRMD